KLVDELRTHAVHRGDDEPEMMFRGLVEGIDGAGFSGYARKMVILVGDCGDVSGWEYRRKADPGYGEKYNAEAIVSRLVPGKRARRPPIELYALHTRSDGTEYTKAFRTQVEEIGRLYRERLKESAFEGAAHYYPPAATDKAAEEVRAQYGRLVKKAEER